jgi:hypothetical protein
MEKRQPLQKNVGKTGYLQAENWNICLSSYININPKWIKDLNIRSEILKQQDVGWNTVEHIGIGNDILTKTPVVQQIR